MAAGTSGSVGEQELELLKFIALEGAVSAGQAAERYGEPRGLARSTVLTMMERLRAKGRLKRKRVDGVFQYHSPVSARELLSGTVRAFVESALAGSVSPVVSYLTETEEVSDEELAQLERLVARLQSKRDREGS